MWFMKKKMDNNFKNKICEDLLIQEILPVLKRRDVFLVGGYVRDLFLSKKTNDRDIVVFNYPAIKLAKEIQQKIDGYFVELDNENYIYRVVSQDKENYIDVAQGVGGDIYDDLSRRDFSVNALAVNLQNFEIIDVLDGLSDLENKKIKLVKNQNLFDDALRMIRAARFCATLDFDVDENLIKLIAENKNCLRNIAKERINYELMKIFEGKYTDKGLLLLDEMGILEDVFPEMKAVKTIPPNSHHHLSLFYHCIETINNSYNQIKKADDKVKNYFEQKNLGAHPRYAFLKLAAFLHDIGKPATWTIEEETGRHRFIKHDDVGAKMCVNTLRNLKFSNKQIKYIQNLIKYHIYPSALAREEGNEKTFNRYFRKTGECALDVIFLAMGDRLSARGEAITDEMVEKNINHLNLMTSFYFNNFLNQNPLEKLLDGNEIMELLNIDKSPVLGKIIKELKEAQINSEVVTKADAVKFIKNIDFRNF